MSAPIIISRPHKSLGLAILLAIAFGPFGLLYASITGGLVMILTPIFLWLLFILGLFQGKQEFVVWVLGFIVLFAITYWMIGIIWAIVAVNSYNSQVDEDLKKELDLWNRFNSKEPTQVVVNIGQGQAAIPSASSGASKPDLQAWLIANPGKSINDYFAKFGR